VAHPVVLNGTGFSFEPLVLPGRDGRPLLVPLVKATFDIRPDTTLVPAEEQKPVLPAGEFWGEPDVSSYKYEPETAFIKPSTDVVLIGEACARRGRTKQTTVTFQLGALKKEVRVTGDREWGRVLGLIRTSDPKPFERMPLTWERAFGGWDRGDPDAEKHGCDPRNPVGRGFHRSRVKFTEGIALPNLEDPKKPVRAYGDRPAPAGFGFVSPGWEPRIRHAGTYDAAWLKTRSPALPDDFQTRFFNAAPEGLIASGYLRGDEPALVEGVTPDAPLAFRLPGLPPPLCRVELSGSRRVEVELRLDTVIVQALERCVLFLWRGSLPLARGLEEVSVIRVGPEEKTRLVVEPFLEEEDEETQSAPPAR
jgi:hypothetical protein